MRERIKTIINNKFNKNVSASIFLIYHLLWINPRFLFKKFGYLNKTRFDLERLFGVKSNKKVRVGKFLFYPEGGFLLYESFNDEIYRPLLSCQNVLNLGGFIGDSAIYLSQGCNKIYSFEPEKEKFETMVKNISLNRLKHKVLPYNYAVISSDKKTLEINKANNFDVSASVTKYNVKALDSEVVNCVSIGDVLKLNNFDGLECDIEGAEWEIIDWFMKNPKKWNFDKSIFELHFSSKDYTREIQILKRFLLFLKSKGMVFRFFRESPERPVKFDVKFKDGKDHLVIMLYAKRVSE